MSPGQYRYGPWFAVRKADVRPRFVPVAGQEDLSSDGVTVKVSLAANVEVVDPENEIHHYMGIPRLRKGRLSPGTSWRYVMGQITQVEEIALVLLLLIGALLGQWKTGQVVAQVDQSSEEQKRSLHRLAAARQCILADYLPHQRSKHLWHLIIESILLAGLMLLMLRATGMIPVQ